MKKLSILLTALLFSVLTISAADWKFDSAHTTVGFEVSHMVISSVDGKFKKFEGTVGTDGMNWETADIQFSVYTNSIDTDNEDRDKHLRSDDFFAADQYPKMIFVSKTMEKVGENKYKLIGDLTIKGTTKEITLDVTHNGTITDPYGNTRAGFSLDGEIDRFDYGIEWDKTLDAGGLVVGETVDINIETELIQQK